jgi:hypothetical protein
VDWLPADEGRHADALVEAWWFWGWTPSGDAGLYVGLELHDGGRFDYWAGLVRAAEPYLYLPEIDSTGLRSGLEIKPPEMWADHVCDAAFEQWSLGNEGHAVMLDDPSAARGLAYGRLVPVAFDVEWYATWPPSAIEGGYEQVGEVDAVVELAEGPFALKGLGRRVHVWGRPWLPSPPAAGTGWGLRAPYRRHDGLAVEQVLTSTGWHAWVVP